MPRNIPARKSEPAPSSQTRPKLATTRPSPMDEPMPDFEAGRDAAKLADELDSIRVKLAEFEREKETIEARLIEAMKAAKKKNLGTLHGRVTLLEATEDKQVPDLDAAVALLEKHAISQPPTMEAWLAQHRLTMPTKTKKGLSDRIKFEMNK
jgi:hypothetical protein